jgi:hypothetical protein
MASNKYKVPSKQWDKWTVPAQKVFNQTYSWLNNNQAKTKHPKDTIVSKTLWKTVAWNAAWIAAGASDNIEIVKVIEVK